MDYTFYGYFSGILHKLSQYVLLPLLGHVNMPLHGFKKSRLVFSVCWPKLVFSFVIIHVNSRTLAWYTSQMSFQKLTCSSSS